MSSRFLTNDELFHSNSSQLSQQFLSMTVWREEFYNNTTTLSGKCGGNCCNMDKLRLQFVVPGHNKSEIHLLAKDITQFIIIIQRFLSPNGCNEGYQATRGLFHVSMYIKVKPSVVAGRCSRGAFQNEWMNVWLEEFISQYRRGLFYSNEELCCFGDRSNSRWSSKCRVDVWVRGRWFQGLMKISVGQWIYANYWRS